MQVQNPVVGSSFQIQLQLFCRVPTANMQSVRIGFRFLMASHNTSCKLVTPMVQMDIMLCNVEMDN